MWEFYFFTSILSRSILIFPSLDTHSTGCVYCMASDFYTIPFCDKTRLKEGKKKKKNSHTHTHNRTEWPVVCIFTWNLLKSNFSATNWIALYNLLIFTKANKKIKLSTNCVKFCTGKVGSFDYLFAVNFHPE